MFSSCERIGRTFFLYKETLSGCHLDVFLYKTNELYSQIYFILLGVFCDFELFQKIYGVTFIMHLHFWDFRFVFEGNYRQAGSFSTT